MSLLTVEIGLPNALLIVEDSSGGELPFEIEDGPVSATATAIAIATRHEADGDTVVHFIGPVDSSVGVESRTIAWSGTIRVNNAIAASTVNGDVLMELPLKGILSVKIAVDDTSEPSEVWVFVGTAEVS